ncbi:MAG: hypothetical protein LKM30_06450 [Bacilli bacterium]|jgi:trk system potassium uptake protein TrkH|nr:hypothetical protein [Bacilli bacterium]
MKNNDPSKNPQTKPTVTAKSSDAANKAKKTAPQAVPAANQRPSPHQPSKGEIMASIKEATVKEITELERKRKKSKNIKPETTDPVSGPRLVLGYIGVFLIMIGALSLLSLLVLVNPAIGTNFYTGKEVSTWAKEALYWWVIVVPAACSMVVGFLFYLNIHHRKKARLKGMEDIILVFTVWVSAILIYAAPFLLSHYVNPELNFTFTQAVFESTSGLTTTGLSVMVTDDLPAILLFHRSLANFVGGVGLVLILTSAVADRSGLNIYLLEGHNDQLLPNLMKSARMIFIIYSAYVLVGAIALMICGCSPLDAICFAMAAVSTGGLASHSESAAWFETNLPYANSVAIEVVLIVLMVLGMTNFVIHFYLWRGKFKKAFSHYEFLVFVGLMIVVYPFMVYGMTEAYRPFNTTALGAVGDGFRHGTFEFVSALSTTGFCSLDPTIFSEAYSNLPAMALFAFIILMTIGGQNGSTSGGLKQSRLALFFLNIKWYVERSVTRTEMVRTHYVYRLGEKVPVQDEEIKEASNYIGLYFGVAFLSTIVLTCYGVSEGAPFSFSDGLDPYSLTSSFFETISCLSAVGASGGLTTFANSHQQWGALWTEIVMMFAGRLEVTIFFITIARGIRLFSSRKNVYPGKDRVSKS